MITLFLDYNSLLIEIFHNYCLIAFKSLYKNLQDIITEFAIIADDQLGNYYQFLNN